MRATEKERDARTKVRERGERFKTRTELLAVDPFDSPKTAKRRNVVVPALRAARAPVLRIAKKQLVAWRNAYRLAFERFRRGDRETELGRTKVFAGAVLSAIEAVTSTLLFSP